MKRQKRERQGQLWGQTQGLEWGRGSGEVGGVGRVGVRRGKPQQRDHLEENILNTAAN